MAELDPSIVDYLGGGAPSPQPIDSGLDPAIVSYLQGGGMQPQQVGAAEYPLPPPIPPPPPMPVPVQRVQTPEYSAMGMNPIPPLNPPPPPTPPPKKIGDEVTITDETPSYGLHPAVADAIQGGFGSSSPDLSVPNISGLAPSLVGALQGGLPQRYEAQPERTLPPGVVVGSADQIAAQIADRRKRQAAADAFDASPEGLARRADAMRMDAVNRQDAADRAQQEAETSLNDANARIQADYNSRQAEQAKIDAANEAKYAADRDALIQQRTAQVGDWAKYQVNTNRDYGVGGLIAIALSGIGDALDHRHGPNAALQIMDSAIDKRIADQYRQKDELGKAVSMTDSQLDVIGRSARDQREAESLQRAALLQQQANELKSAALASANPQVKARAMAMAAQRENDRAVIVAGVATRGAQAARQQREDAQQGFTNRLALAHLGLAQDQATDERLKWRAQLAAEMGRLRAEGNAKQAEALQKQAEEQDARGIQAPKGIVKDATGKPVIGVDGNPKVQYDWLRNQDGTPYLAPKGREKEVQETYTATHQAINALQATNALLEKNGGHLVNSAESRATAQQYARAILAIHKASGINRLSGEAVELANKMADGNIDPDSYIRNAIPNIKLAMRNAGEDLNTYLHHGANYTGPDIKFPTPPPAPPDTPEIEELHGAIKFDPTRPKMAEAKDAEGSAIVYGEESPKVIPKTYKAQIDLMGRMVRDAKASEESRNRATEGLIKLSTEAGSEAVRQYARRAMIQGKGE